MESNLAALTIKDEEEATALVLGRDVGFSTIEASTFNLVGRLLSNRSVNFATFKNTISTVWRPRCGVCITEVGECIYQFRFFHVVDMNRVLDGKPYSFNNHLLLLHHLQPSEILLTVPLYLSPF
uniref:DUF4283 domain-containing protein n=1 Tax=Manihot esculenta TaxID=3983 RepID=A0A199UAI8_MANES